MKAMKFILSLLVIIGFQQTVYGGLNYRKFSPWTLGTVNMAPEKFVPAKIKYSALIQLVQNDESDMILLKDYLALKAVDLFQSTKGPFNKVRKSTEPFINAATAVISTVSVVLDIFLG